MFSAEKYRDKPAQGVFWITDAQNPESGSEFCFLIYSESDGTVLHSEKDLNAKSGITYNHKKLWDDLSRSIKKDKPYNYYPRGRVQIRNGRATVYLNPDINTDVVRDYIICRFGLTEEMGITNVRFISDGSEHYSYIDQV